MAFMVDHQRSNYKHFCKICKKGFMCGRALGGHMRAHGIGDESSHMDDEDPVSDWEDNKHGENNPPSGSSRRMYALRANPNRLKTCRICENCGKEFSSWKSFLEHGKCGSEDVESLMSSHESDEEDGNGRRGCGWSKRKRSMRINVDDENATCPSNEEEDLANCLVMLSNARVDPSNAEAEESCTSASRDEERRKPVNFAAPPTYRAPIPGTNTTNNNNANMDKAKGVARGLFECKACKKVFNSHQALGGHRASHKKVKGCFAARLDQVDDYVPEEDFLTHEDFFPMPKLASNNQLTPYDSGSSYNAQNPSTSKRKSKVHECSICHRVFSSGQALGGHKRCHWITSNSPDTASLAKLQQFHDHLEQLQQSQPPSTKFHGLDPLDLKLDLNIPVPSPDEIAGRRETRMVNPMPLQTDFDPLSTNIYLQSWALGLDAKEREVHNQHDHPQQIHSDREHSTGKNVDNSKGSKTIYAQNSNEINNVEEDEGDSKVKLAKLSGEGSSSSWLQVGIGPTSTDHDCHASTGK